MKNLEFNFFFFLGGFWVLIFCNGGFALHACNVNAGIGRPASAMGKDRVLDIRHYNIFGEYLACDGKLGFYGLSSQHRSQVIN